MPEFSFSARSIKNLDKVHPDLQELAHRALQWTRVDFAIISGLRTKEEQNALVANGKSKDPNSKHLHGLAIDFAAIDPATGKAGWDRALMMEVGCAFYHAAVERGTRMLWGGMWTGFEDCPHIELIDPRRWDGRQWTGIEWKLLTDGEAA
ncbi:MAG: M15 family metallopeptidase [Alphaproteobacteria bacterium]|nr:M15 family metallopeptidase [Alphaproteobacteria bacterium]